MAITHLTHVGLQVKDIKASIKFYQDVLGLKLLDRQPHVDEAISLAFLGFYDSDKTVIELIEGYNPDLPTEGKVHHLAFAVTDIESDITQLKEKGVTFLEEDITVLPSGTKYIFFSGPDGEWIELFEQQK